MFEGLLSIIVIFNQYVMSATLPRVSEFKYLRGRSMRFYYIKGYIYRFIVHSNFTGYEASYFWLCEIFLYKMEKYVFGMH